MMSDISRTSKSMEYSIDGISDKFAFRRGIADATLLAKARAFIDEIPPFKADFIAFGMPANFDVALNTAANAFEATFGAVDSATAEHITGTATVGAKVQEGMVIIRILDGIAKNVYASTRENSPPGPPPRTSKKHRRQVHQRRHHLPRRDGFFTRRIWEKAT